MTGTLYIVATPIGNLDDISSRAIKTLREVDVIAAEDTRHVRKLLDRFGIPGKLMSYWAPREKSKTEEILVLLQNGKNVALVSDAGTPCISDPGTVVVAEAAAKGFAIVPIPGPSSVTTALSISGFTADRFVFEGFLPSKESHRKKRLSALALEERTMVFFEAPHRILETLADLEESFGPDRRAVLAREITKFHEETIRGTLGEILDGAETMTVAGEFVVVVEGRAGTEEVSEEEALAEMKRLMKGGMSRKDASRRVADTYGLSRKRLYDASME